MTLRRLALAAVGLVLVAILAGGALLHQSRLAAGREVLVAAEAADPRAFLTGHFARLALRPNAISLPAATAATFTAGEPAWLTLAPDPGPDGWRAEALSHAKPSPGPDKVAAVVTVRDVAADAASQDGARRTVALAWGPDRIYLSQAEAEAVERATRQTAASPDAAPPRVRVVLAIGPDGAALVKGVEIDGRRIEARW